MPKHKETKIMNVQTLAERHSETLEDIAKFFAGLTFYGHGPKSGLSKPITLAQPTKMEVVQ